jgi:hypothetical protein
VFDTSAVVAVFQLLNGPFGFATPCGSTDRAGTMPGGGTAMPMHDWTLVPDGIYHAFHHTWVAFVTDRLNNRGLPDELYALPEQVEAGFNLEDIPVSEAELYRRRKNHIAVRHVSGDRVVAVLEIVSPGDKSAEYPLETFVRKACDFLDRRVHRLILDPFPPGPRDPDGVHPLIWREFSAEPFRLPADTPLTLVAYEAGVPLRAYAEAVAVGSRLPDMPLFIARDRHVLVPLEETYQAAFDVQPRRWRKVLQPPGDLGA